jgi:hypothetical protein
MGYLKKAAIPVFKPKTGTQDRGLLIPRSLVRIQHGPNAESLNTTRYSRPPRVNPAGW